MHPPNAKTPMKNDKKKRYSITIPGRLLLVHSRIMILYFCDWHTLCPGLDINDYCTNDGDLNLAKLNCHKLKCHSNILILWAKKQLLLPFNAWRKYFLGRIKSICFLLWRNLLRERHMIDLEGQIVKSNWGFHINKVFFYGGP